jgi:hypothetical protein
VGLLLLLLVEPASSAVLFQVSGLSSAGVAVSFKADLSVIGDTLTVVLTNNSPVHSQNPDDTLGSFYFDILNAGVRPSLTYTSAFGELYSGVKSGPDVAYNGAGLDDIKSLSPATSAWIFAVMTPTANPYLGFGIGTVGNANLGVNNLPAMDGIETAIYTGDITTQNLNGKLLVKDTATFTFGGLTGFTEANIWPQVAFGLGTSPDSLMTTIVPTPEPATLAILCLGALLLRRRVA